MSDQLAVIKKYVRSDEIMTRFREVLSNREAPAYVNSVLLAVANSPKLMECTPQSIVSSCLRAATLRLSVDPSIGQAYPVPFKGKATLIVGYKGYIHMALRTNKYRDLNVGKIYEGQEVTEDQITGHIKLEGMRTSDKVIGYVGYFVLTSGYSKTIYMTVEEIHALAKKHSKSYGYDDSAWTTNTIDMEKKTVMRRLLTHWGVLDPHDANALEAIDDSGETNGYRLPEVDEVIVQVDKKYTEAENMKVLGFEPDKPKITVIEPEPTPEPAPVATMPPDEVISNYFNRKLGIIPTTQLEYLLNQQTAKKPDEGTKETDEVVTAIREVLAVRKA